MAFFPLFVDLSGKTVLVVGGGTIAERRVRTILPFAGRVRVVSKGFSEGLLALAGESGRAGGELILTRKAFDPEDLEGAALVLACTGDRELNSTAARLGRARGIPANNCADRHDCDFLFPGLARHDPVVVGVTAGGEAHGLVKKIREKTQHLIDEIMEEAHTAGDEIMEETHTAGDEIMEEAHTAGDEIMESGQGFTGDRVRRGWDSEGENRG